jgi:hypothetical protein
MADLEDRSSPAALPAKPEPDAYGQAALMLAESTLHALVDKATFSASEAVTVLQIAAEVKQELAASTGESDGRLHESLNLLTTIQNSFEADIKHPK